MQKTVRRASPSDALKQSYARSRSNLLLMILLTVVNLIMFACGSYTVLLFSATVPYYLVLFGSLSQIAVFSTACITVSVITLVLYLICWFFSKKHYGWMIGALVLFILDSIALALLLLLVGELSGLFDIAIHVIVLYYLIVGVSSGVKLTKVKDEVNEPDCDDNLCSDCQGALRRADADVKHRVLLESEFGGYSICYRRVKTTNELVVNGYVYDEFIALAEPPHELFASVNGHTVTAGTNSLSKAFITFDGEKIAEKFRLI